MIHEFLAPLLTFSARGCRVFYIAFVLLLNFKTARN